MSKKDLNRFKVFEVQTSDMVNWMGQYSTEHDAFINSLKCMDLNEELWDVLVSAENESKGECSITINIKVLDGENGKVIQFTRSDYQRDFGEGSATRIYIIDTDPPIE